MSDFIIPVIVVCCVAFLGISTGVACFLHHRSRSRPVRGIVLREDLAVAVPGRVVDDDAQSPSSPASVTAVRQPRLPAPRSGRTTSPLADSGAFGDDGDDEVNAADRGGYEVREVYNLSAAERSRREHHNRRLNAEDARMIYRLRASGEEHPLDGTPLARLVTFFREWTQRQPAEPQPGDPAEHREGDGNGAPQPGEPEQAAPSDEREGASAEDAYGRYLVAVDIALHETESQRHNRRKARAPNDAESSSTADPFGGRTQRDWEALHSTSGIDYMTNQCTPYLTPSSADRSPK